MKIAFEICGNRKNRHVDTCTYELMKSAGFAYGNGTCVYVEFCGGGGYGFTIDTRYEKGLNEETFPEWAYNDLRKRTRPEFEIKKL